MGRCRGRVDMFSCSVRPICATDCTPLDYCNAWVDPKLNLELNVKALSFECKEFIAYRIVALEWLKRINSRYRCWIAHPLQGLPVGYNPNVFHGVYGIEKLDESFLVMRLGKPSSMIKQSKWSPNKIKQAKYLSKK